LVASSIDGSRFRLRRFAHKSGIHVHGVCSDPRHYEADDPAASGSPRLIVLSKLIGRTGLRALLARHGFEADEQGLGRLLGIVKSDDLLELADPEEIVRYFEENRAARRSAGTTTFLRPGGVVAPLRGCAEITGR
jgi:isopropylmalate/homocitrate/citramalate synthase